MKALNWKKILPHIIAIVIFIIIAAVFCKPGLEGKVLYQHDIVQYEGASKDITDYIAKHGHAPLWTNGMFSGMPTYQIWMPANNVLPHYVNSILTLGLPQPMQFFFLACLLFYFLSQVARVNPWVGVFGALAFAYSTYNPVIIAAGHVTKMWCIAYMPAMLASLMLIYRKKYLLGGGLLALFTATIVGLNHLQISYYLFLILSIFTIANVVVWIKNKQYSHLVKALAITAVAAIIGVMVNAVTLLTTYEYSKETIRGGSLLKDTSGTKSTGLTKDYAFEYSYKPIETFTVMFPRIAGGSNGIREIGEDSKVAQALGEINPQMAQQLAGMGIQSSYWGSLSATSGPPYIGAIICFLFILFVIFIKGATKWWIVAASIFAIMLSWGKFFPQFNYLMFDYFPMYNKFRAPSMSVVILEFLWPLAAILVLQYIITNINDSDFKKKLKYAGIATAGVFLIAFMTYLSMSYEDEGIKQLKQQVAGQSPQVSEPVMTVLKALVEDRKSIFLKDIFKAIALTGIFYFVIFLYSRKKIQNISVVLGIGIVLLLIDLLPTGNVYLTKRANGEDSFAEAEESKKELTMGKANQQILQDKSWYRVLNLSVSPFQDASTSFFHKSIGGYHAAKIVRYQDVWENEISNELTLMRNDSLLSSGLSKTGYPGLNMLNTKYIIFSNPGAISNDRPSVLLNPNALGAAWLVKEVRFANTLQDEMKDLKGLDPSQTAIVPANEKSKVTQPVYDSAAKIEMVSNDNDIVTYKSTAAANQFAVFSEVYYSEGWNAYVDGKKADYVKTNYTIRGMNVPAGSHTIEFKFEPTSFTRGKQLTTVGQVLVLLLLAGGIFVAIREKKSSGTAA